MRGMHLGDESEGSIPGFVCIHSAQGPPQAARSEKGAKCLRPTNPRSRSATLPTRSGRPPTADRPPRAANYNLDHASHACVCGPCARFGAAIATGDGRARACARWLRLPCSPRSPCTRSSRTSRRCPFQTSRTTSRTRRCCTCTCPLGRSRHGSSRRLVKGGSRREASGGVWSHIES